MSEPIRLGQAAQRILDDELMQDVLTAVQESYIADWKQAQTTALRDAMWYGQRAIEDVRTRLKAVRDRGTVAQNQKGR